MKKTKRILLGAVIVGGAHWMWKLWPAVEHRSPGVSPVALADSSEAALDTALACLTLAAAAPEQGELTEARFDQLLSLLANVVQTYTESDFDAYLSLRKARLASPLALDVETAEQLRMLSSDLGLVQGSATAAGVDALRGFWAQYWATPPVQRFLPEDTVCRLRSEPVQRGEREAWHESFAEFRDSFEGAIIGHRLMLPHPRSMQQVFDNELVLTWFDVALRYETNSNQRARLLLRFVDDPELGWFLQRADSLFSNGHDPASDRSVLIL